MAPVSSANVSASVASLGRAAERLRAARPIAIAALATAIVMLLLASGGGVWSLVGGQDLHGAFLPKYIEAARALFGEHRLPLWNPWELCGTPLFAVIQGLVLYPPAPLLFWILTPFWALQALYAFNVFVLAWGTAAYLREHEIGGSSALLAVLVTVDGVFMSYSMVGFDHPNFLASVAWLPWVLLAWGRTLTHGVRPWLGVTALFVALLWLAGYPDFAMDFSVLLATVALVSGGATIARRLLNAVAAYLLGTALVAVQLLPLAEAIGESFRAQAMSDYDAPRQLFATVSSGLFGPLVLHRFGIAALVMVLLALWPPMRSRLAWMAALTVAILAGDPPLSYLYRLPPFSGVRFALGWSHIAALFVGLLVAAALEGGLSRMRGAARVAILALAAVVASGSAWTIARAPRLLRPVAPDYVLLRQRVPILKAAQDNLPGHPRVIASAEIDAGMTVRERMPSASGYDPTMPPRRIKRLINAVNGSSDTIVRGMRVDRDPRLASMMGVGLVSVPRWLARAMTEHGFATISMLPPNEVLMYREPVPRARIVHRATIVDDEESSFAATIDPQRDITRTAVVETTDPPPSLVEPPSDAAESVSFALDLPEQIVLDASLATPGLLVLTDTWYPGWVADVDGRDAPVLRADYGFRAIALEAGVHRVRLRYRPRSLDVGLGVTILAAVALVASIVPPSWRQR